MAKITQSEFIRHYNEKNREQFNPVYFERNNQDIMDCVRKVILSCEKDKYFTLQVKSIREIYNYEEIYNMLRAYQESHKKKNVIVENQYDYINIKDSDIMLMEVKYFIRHNGVEKQEVEVIKEDGTKSKETIDVKDPYTILTVLIALPRFVHKYYFRLNGNYYTSTFQIVDGSTYNNTSTNNGPNRKADCNTFKTLFMPVRIYKKYKDMPEFYTKSTIRAVLYGSNIFNNYTDCMYYILANYGLYGTFDFLDIHCIYINSYPLNPEEYFNFNKHNAFISVPKTCFQDNMVQSLVASIYGAITKDATPNDLFNIRYWIRNLGIAYKGGNSLDKGLFVLDSIDGIYDLITQEELHLPPDLKSNIYQILRWIMREFYYIKQKDNVDITLKRIRIAEYIAHLYAIKLSRGLHRISDAGKRVTLNSVIKAIRIDPMYVVNNAINMSNLVQYVDLVNDDDAFLALKCTYKGISGLGEDGSSIARNYRYVDPTHAGILDLDASGASDPGMSGIICPMAPMRNNSFTDYQEPNYWEGKYKQLQTDWFKRKQVQSPFDIIDSDKAASVLKQDYESLRKEVVEETLNIDKIICPFYNIHDPSIDYSSAGSLLKKQEEEEQKGSSVNSLFNYNLTEEEGVINNEQDFDYYE